MNVYNIAASYWPGKVCVCKKYTLQTMSFDTQYRREVTADFNHPPDTRSGLGKRDERSLPSNRTRRKSWSCPLGGASSGQKKKKKGAKGRGIKRARSITPSFSGSPRGTKMKHSHYLAGANFNMNFYFRSANATSYRCGFPVTIAAAATARHKDDDVVVMVVVVVVLTRRGDCGGGGCVRRRTRDT